MAIELSDALYDLIRSKRKCKMLNNEWDDCKRLVEEKNVESNYQQILRFILDNAEMHEHHKWKRDDIIYIDEEDDCDRDNDLHYKLFESSLKEHGKSYVLESEKDGVSVSIKYEAENGSGDASEQESQQKMMTCAEQIIGLSNQKPGLLNNRAAVVQHPSDMQAYSGNCSSIQCARLLMNLVKRENARGKESELLSQNSYIRINCSTGNECDHDYNARPVEKDKVQSRTNSCKVVKGGHGADVEGSIQVDKGKLCERVYPAQLGEKDKEENHRKSKKVIQIDNGHSYSMLGPSNNKLVQNESEHSCRARSGDNSNVQNPRKKFKVVKGTNLVKEENGPDRTEVIQIDNARFYQKPGPRNNWVEENLCDPGDQPQPGEKDKVPSQIYLQQLDKGKNVVGEDGGANRRAVVRIVNEHEHQKAGQKNNWLKQCPNEHVYHAQPFKEFKEHIDRKLKGKNVVRGDHGISNQKSAFGIYALKSEPDDSMKTRLYREGTNNKIRSVKVANFPLIYNISDEDSLEKEGDDEIVPEVEILDSAAFIKQGILSPFVPSKRFHRSMMDDDFQDLGRPSVCDEFRKEVLNVLRKPYDIEEYKRHKKAIEAGSYLDHYRDLGKKLTKYRYKKEKRLAILRGFFFWLQNLTREGAFQPWKDRQCLAVEPPFP